ncbi:lysine transporter LysM [Vibrio profundum]|uniref:LysM-like peptidoglycan-binding domain-containing protein n=1 Tax=Vibrio profundum TaxID=2910247 RepID=UPI003D0AEDDE
MNRRKAKPAQQDHVELLKVKWQSIEWQKFTFSPRGAWQSLPKLHRRSLSVLIPVVVLLAVMPTMKDEQQQIQPDPNQRMSLTIDPQSLSDQASSNTDAQQITSQSKAKKTWRNYTVKSGDTLANVFRENGLSMSDLHALVKVEGTGSPLSHIRKGQLVRYKLLSDGQLDMLQLEKPTGSIIFFRLSNGGFARQ